MNRKIEVIENKAIGRKKCLFLTQKETGDVMIENHPFSDVKVDEIADTSKRNRCFFCQNLKR